MQNAGWSTSWNQDCGRKCNNLRYADNTTLMAESEEEPKTLLMKVKEESEKVGLKLNIQKMKTMASGHVTVRHGIKVTVRYFIFCSKITADGDCSHEIKRRWLLGKKAMTRQYIKQQRHHFADKGPYSQSYGFSSSHVWMWELYHKKGWAPKNWRFWTVVLKKSLELQDGQMSQSERKSILNIHWKDWCWSSNTLATWWELTH